MAQFCIIVFVDFLQCFIVIEELLLSALFFIFVDPPTIKQLVKAVASVSDWRMLGINLDLNMTELNDIHTTYHVEGLNTLKMAVFDKWLKKCPAASWDGLIKALTDMDEVTAAGQIKASRPKKPLPETGDFDFAK